MRILLVVCALLAVGCKKKPKPVSLTIDHAYWEKSPETLQIGFSLYDDSDEAVAIPGTLEVERYAGAATAEHGKALCAGRADVTKDRYEDDHGDVAVILTGCPALPASVPGSVRVQFVPADQEKDWTAWADVQAPDLPDPAVAHRKEIDDKIVALCAAKDTANATALRAQVAPAIEKAAGGLAPALHQAITAMLAQPDPCARTLAVYERWKVSGGGASDSTHDRFAQAVKRADWLDRDRVKRVAENISERGAGWLVGVSGSGDPDAAGGAKLVMDFDVFWNDNVALGGLAFPRLRRRGVATLTVPPSFTTTLVLPERAFASADKVEYRKGQEDMAAAGAEIAQIRESVDISPLFRGDAEASH